MASPVSLDNIQGDILLAGLPKKTETFFFFQIDDIQGFRNRLNKLIPLITTANQASGQQKKISDHKNSLRESYNTNGAQQPVNSGLLTLSGVQIAFTNKGLKKMGINDEIGDKAFNAGMLADAQDLGDQGAVDPTSGKFDPDWTSQFKEDIHGLILITGDCQATLDRQLERIKEIFLIGEENPGNATIHEIISLVGSSRPGKHSGHEHFDFLDGVSQPAVQDIDTNPNPGQETVPQGVILLGREGDKPNVPNVTKRPDWAVDGSFLVFRYLLQKVPEFNTFLRQNAIHIPDDSVPPELGSELLGARLFGRWKSGAPIDLTPLRDDPALGRDPSRNNNFRFDSNPQSQERCPFAAHIRKTNPRADLEDLSANPNDPIPKTSVQIRRIIRRSIQFGPEVTPEETALNETTKHRGLLFVAYQSNIVNGFRFIQHSWANNINFPFGKTQVAFPGFDAIIGQTTNLAPRTLSGTDPNNQDATLGLSQQWVDTKGGEYFFSPSLQALKETFALAA